MWKVAIRLEVLNEVAFEHGAARTGEHPRQPQRVDPKTHLYFDRPQKGNKFGVAHERTLATYQRAASLPGLRVVGIDCHIGSQITEVSPYLDAGCARSGAKH